MLTGLLIGQEAVAVPAYDEPTVIREVQLVTRVREKAQDRLPVLLARCLC
jgi:hypothetical protein